MKSILKPLSFVLLSLVILSSCVEDEGLSSTELHEIVKSSAGTTHQILVSALEVVEATSHVLSEEEIAIENPATQESGCAPSLHRQYIRDLTHYDTIIYAGTITMDYGNGSVCSTNSTVKKGKIEDFFTYIINLKDGETFSVKQTISFDNFELGNIQLDGILRLKGVTGSPDTITTEGSKITYDDGSSIFWNATLINHRFDPDLGNTTKGMSGSIQSSTTDARYFSATIIEPVVFKHDCFDTTSMIPVSGRIEVIVNEHTSIVDYGNGECDRTYTVRINNSSVTYTF